MPIAGLAAKALPMLIDNAPEIWAAATQLIASARKAKAAIPVEAADAAAAGEPGALDAAIRDLESSLLTLNAQMEKSGALVASLAKQNERLAEQVEAQRAWLIRLTVATLLSLALAIAAVSGVLGH
jgi:hypothetical protein